MRTLVFILVLLLLSGCAHQVVMTPDQAQSCFIVDVHWNTDGTRNVTYHCH